MNAIETDDAPAAIGPYSQGIIDGDTIYVSGQGAIDPQTGEVGAETIEAETALTLENIQAILREVEASLADVVQANVYVTDMSDYGAVNEVYAEYMSEPYPARAAVGVADLPVDIGVEIEVVARRK